VECAVGCDTAHIAMRVNAAANIEGSILADSEQNTPSVEVEIEEEVED
jgi:hypothetical protein